MLLRGNFLFWNEKSYMILTLHYRITSPKKKIPQIWSRDGLIKKESEHNLTKLDDLQPNDLPSSEVVSNTALLIEHIKKYLINVKYLQQLYLFSFRMS